jgi:hypothetical protein
MLRIMLIYFVTAGSAAAVEHVLSGGRDTVSPCHASLKADTIRALMVVKAQLCMA